MSAAHNHNDLLDGTVGRNGCRHQQHRIFSRTRIMPLIELFAMLVFCQHCFHSGAKSFTFQIPINHRARGCFVPKTKGNGAFRRERCSLLLTSDASLPLTPVTKVEENSSDDEDEEERFLGPKDMATLPEGIPKGFFVVEQYAVPESSLKDWKEVGLSSDVIERVDLQSHNISLPAALVLLDVIEYPSISRARKACRKGHILVHRGPLHIDSETALATVFNPGCCFIGRVGDRVFPGDIVAKQVRMGSGYFPILNYKKPPFELPVLLQDDHFALVNKPAGVVVYNQHKGGHGVMTVRAMLPFVLEPPQAGTVFVMRRPTSVHRLDKPTSGILCVAKTKPAMVSLSRQFHDRVVKKTYMAIVNGIPQEDDCATITSKEAFDLGVDVDPKSDQIWQLIDSALEEKSGVTVWRAVRYVKSLHANDGYLTLVELKPKTGRYHQLRRHMAWVCRRPLVGDSEYDGGTESAMRFRENGLFLCSTTVTLQHPFYNSFEGKQEWKNLQNTVIEERYRGQVFEEEDGKVIVRANVCLPEKFEKLLQRSEERWAKLAD